MSLITDILKINKTKVGWNESRSLDGGGKIAPLPSVLWYSFEGGYQCFGEICYFHLQCSSEDETAHFFIVKYKTGLLEYKVVEIGKILVMAKFGNLPVPFRTERCYMPAPH